MFEWEFGNPWFSAAVGARATGVLAGQAFVSLLSYSSLTLLADTRRSWRQRLSRLPAILLALAIAALVVVAGSAAYAPAGNACHSRGYRHHDGGRSVVVDGCARHGGRGPLRQSLGCQSKTCFVDFVLGTDRTAGRGRPDDLIGIVTFAHYADSLCPLTLDHGNLVNIVKDLEIVTEQDEDGTAVGDGLGLAVERLRRSKARSRVAILLTDGVTNTGVIEPLKAAELARQRDIKVYCIGAGTRGVAPMPAVDFFGRATLVARPVQIDEEALQQIAEKTGGKYFRAVDQQTLADIYREIDALERTEVTEVKYLQYASISPTSSVPVWACWRARCSSAVPCSGDCHERVPFRRAGLDSPAVAGGRGGRPAGFAGVPWAFGPRTVCLANHAAPFGTPSALLQRMSALALIIVGDADARRSPDATAMGHACADAACA